MTDKAAGTVTAESLNPSAYERDIAHTAKGGSIVAVGRMANYVTRFATTFLLARLLTADQYGMYSLAITAATIAAALAMFGQDTVVMRQIAIMNSRRDTPGVWGAIQVGLGTGIVLSVITSTLLFALAYPIAEHIFHEPRLAPLLQLASLVAPFLTMSDILAGATRGFKNMRDTVVAQNFVQPIVRLILIVIFALIGMDMYKAILIFGAADLSASILLLYFLNKHFSLQRSFRTARRDTQAMLSFSFPLWLSDMLFTFRSHLQTLILGSLGTMRGVGIFTVANQANTVGNMFHASIVQSARPLVAELHDKNNFERLNHLYRTSTKWSTTLNLPFIIIMMLFPKQILSIFGKSFEDGAMAFAILALVSLIHVITGMAEALLEMTGHAKIKLFNSVIKISLAILLNFLLIPRYGILGAAVSALIHQSVADGLPLIQIWFLYRLLPYSRAFYKPILAGLCMVAAWFFTRGLFLDGDNFFVVILHGSFLMVIYAAVTLLLGFSSEERALLARFRRKVRFLPQ
jgi:O-antigen/teichoic acid export membrane protein